MKGKLRWLLVIPLFAVALGLYRLRFDVEVLNLLPTGEPVVEGLKLFQEYFANARELIITVGGKDADSTEAAAKFLAERLRKETNLVAEATWEPPWLEHPDQSSELIGYLWLNQSPAAFGALTNRLSGSNVTALLQDARERLASSFSPDDIARLSYDPFGLTRLPESATSSAAAFGQGQELFASPDGTFRMLFVEAQYDLSSYRACEKWLQKIKGIIDSAETKSGMPLETKIRYTGRPAFVAEIGGGMERDMGAPSAGTLGVIALLFYLTHRRWRPLLWLIVLLIFILATALALGGLIYGTLNVVSLGFASILLGLAEDFGIVLYQESRTHPELSLSAIRKLARPGIFWSSITTCGAFLLLNLSGLPGLGQLGTLVAVGIAVSAVVMLYLYLPPLMPKGGSAPESNGTEAHADTAGDAHAGNATDRFSTVAWGLTIVVVLAAASFIWLKPPRFDRSPDSLRPKNSLAYTALDELKSAMNRRQEPLWVVVEGRTEPEVQARLAKVETILAREVSAGTISGFTTAASLWPNLSNQQANRSTAAALIDRRESLHQQAQAAGFATASLGLADGVLQTWQRAIGTTGVFWPTNENSHWILEKLTARGPNEWLAVSLIHPQTNLSARAIATLARDVRGDGIWLSGWDLLGPTISNLVIREIPKVVIPILLVVLASLWLAYRSVREVLLSLATIAVAGLWLEIIMSTLGWTWNMMNLMSIPLLLGMGVDFAIHIQLALRRYGGDSRFVRGSIGKALLLAGSTTVAGFASVAFSSNAGLASLGKICATGITCAMLTAVFLLPSWWKRYQGSSRLPVTQQK